MKVATCARFCSLSLPLERAQRSLWSAPSRGATMCRLASALRTIAAASASWVLRRSDLGKARHFGLLPLLLLLSRLLHPLHLDTTTTTYSSSPRDVPLRPPLQILSTGSAVQKFASCPGNTRARGRPRLGEYHSWRPRGTRRPPPPQQVRPVRSHWQLAQTTFSTTVST